MFEIHALDTLSQASFSKNGEKHITCRVAQSFIIFCSRTEMIQSNETVCNFESMESPVELNRLFLKLFCYVTWFDET